MERLIKPWLFFKDKTMSIWKNQTWSYGDTNIIIPLLFVL